MSSTSTSSAQLDKTAELFRARLVTSLARAALNPDEYLHWSSSAFSIQQAIYRIDTYYESHGSLYLPTERPMWELVESRIKGSNGSMCFSVWKSFSELRKYGHVESRIHAADVIDQRELTHIVSLKASDVRIARALIWSYAATPPPTVLDFWATFDECGELIEDLDDITEDGKDWNFNFWLYSYMAEGNVAKSIAGASQTLRDRLSALEGAFLRLPTGDRYRLANIVRRTLREGRRTLEQSNIVFDLISRGQVLRYGGEGLLNIGA